MERADLERWLSEYGRAWEAKDAEGFAHLFTEDAVYYWTPFQPLRGRREIAEAVRGATARQKDIRFRHEVLGIVGGKGLARWWCTLTRPGSGRRVHLDGVFLIATGPEGLCGEFREWWHSDEIPP